MASGAPKYGPTGVNPPATPHSSLPPWSTACHNRPCPLRRAAKLSGLLLCAAAKDARAQAAVRVDSS